MELLLLGGILAKNKIEQLEAENILLMTIIKVNNRKVTNIDALINKYGNIYGLNVTLENKASFLIHTNIYTIYLIGKHYNKLEGDLLKILQQETQDDCRCVIF